MKQKILVVEDDPSILTGLTDILSNEGYEVFAVTQGDEALDIYRQKKPDLILLDIMIPQISGYDVCKEIRRIDLATPILMLTAKSQEVDKVVGLELGADDYIVKPFGLKELVARVRAALRRKVDKSFKKDDAPFSFADIHIDPKTLAATKKGRRIDLSLREIQLLQFFFKHQGEVLDRFTILDEIWGVKYEGTTRTLDQHIAKLRQKIEDKPSNPKYILTIHGAGYKFVAKT
ncbi:MAG: response regulator transcription factor [Candidatus Omnitrophica bacterium]|nr:response regulator transcription factor [Candidatus Omnitrophota bacterium]